MTILMYKTSEGKENSAPELLLENLYDIHPPQCSQFTTMAVPDP